MDISSLTEKMHDFVNSNGWYARDSQKPQTLKNLAISLCLESNEVLEHFQWQENTKEKKELANELADVALYLLQLASIADINLEEAIIRKLKINSRRDWNAQS